MSRLFRELFGPVHTIPRPPQPTQGRASFYVLPLECKLLILREALQEPVAISGVAIAHPRPPIVVSMLRVCYHIRQQLLSNNKRHLRHLIRRYLQVNTFWFHSVEHLAAVTKQALQQDMDHVEDICIYRFRVPDAPNYAALRFWHPEGRLLLHFPTLKRLVLYSHRVVHMIYGPQECEWMSMAENERVECYYDHLRVVVSKLPLLPLGLVLESRSVWDAIVAPLDKRQSWPQGQVFVTISSRRRIAPTGWLPTVLDSVWTTPLVQEVVRMD